MLVKKKLHASKIKLSGHITFSIVMETKVKVNNGQYKTWHVSPSLDVTKKLANVYSEGRCKTETCL